MNSRKIIDSALKLPPDQRFELIDELLRSLARPDPELDRVWIDEAERRLAAHRAGRVEGIPVEDVVGKVLMRVESSPRCASGICRWRALS